MTFDTTSDDTTSRDITSGLRARLEGGSLTCDISDSSENVAVFPLAFGWRSNSAGFLGPAHTVMAPEGDLDAVFAGIRTAAPGSVIVIATGGAVRAIWGETTTAQALGRGVAGVVLDGACRDVAAVRASGLTVVGLGSSPQRAARLGQGELGKALELHGLSVRPGDIIVSDENGTVIVPSAHIATVVAAVLGSAGEEDNET